jgi:hypothetical protein
MCRSGLVDIAGDISCKLCISSPNHEVEFIHSTTLSPPQVNDNMYTSLIER